MGVSLAVPRFLYRQVDACRSPIVSLITAGSIHGEQVTRQPIVLAACASSTITPLGILKTPFRGLIVWTICVSCVQKILA